MSAEGETRRLGSEVDVRTASIGHQRSERVGRECPRGGAEAHRTPDVNVHMMRLRCTRPKETDVTIHGWLAAVREMPEEGAELGQNWADAQDVPGIVPPPTRIAAHG